MTAQNRELSNLHLAQQAFARHDISSSTDRSWVIKRPESGIFWQEIICGVAGTLIVHGDGPDLMFRIYSERDPVELVRFFAESDLSYISGKVVHRELVRAYDDARAREDLDELLKEYEHDDGIVDRLRDLKETLPDEPSPAHAVVEATNNPEDASGFGMVLRADLYYAHAAIRRLDTLLQRVEATRAPEDRIETKVRP